MINIKEEKTHIKERKKERKKSMNKRLVYPIQDNKNIHL